MARTRTAQQETTQDPLAAAITPPLLQSPLTGPALSMQNMYGNSFMADQMMCGPMSPYAGPYTLAPPPGGNNNPFLITPQGPTQMPYGQSPSQNPQLSGPAANQTGAQTNTPPDQQKPPAAQADQVDPKVITAKSDALFKAMDGWGTDENSVMGALKGLKPAEIDALKKEYRDHYGRDLMSDIEGELGGSDLDEAKAHLSSNPVDSALASLNNSVGFWNDDEAKIEQTLRDLGPDQLQELQKRAGNDPKTKEILEKVGGALGGGDKEVFDALMKGDKATADAVRMDEAMGSSSSGWNPLSWGTDEEQVYKLMEGKSPEDRAAMEKAFNERMQKAGKETDLRREFGEEFSGAQKDIADSLLQGDKAGADAARIQDAAEGWGTNEDAIYSMLEGKSDGDRQKLIEAYQKKYGSLDQMLDAELGGDDRERARQLKDKGALDPEFAIKIATDGWGTDEGLLKKTLQGKSKDEVKKIREAWEKANPGQSMNTLLADELSGRDEFEINQALKGEPETPQEQLERARELYEFERGSGSNWFSRTMMDGAELIGMHSKGSQLDRQMERMNDQNWDKGMEHWMAGMGTSTLKGMGTGFVGGSAQQSVKGAFGMQTGFWQSAGVDGLAGTAQGVATTALDPATYSGRPEDIFLNFAKGGGKGGFGGLVQGMADRQIRAGKVEHLLQSGVDPSQIPELSHLTSAEQDRVLGNMLQHDLDNANLSPSGAPTIDTNKRIVLDPQQSPTNEQQVVTQGDDGKIVVTNPGDHTNKVDPSGKVTTPDSTTTTPDPSSTAPKHPAVMEMEAALATNDPSYVQKHLKALTSGKFDDALLETAVALPDLMGSMTPEQISMVGRHLFAEGHQLDALLRNGRKTGQQDGINQYQKLNEAEIAQVKAQQERSKLLGQDWADHLAKQGLDRHGPAEHDVVLPGQHRPLHRLARQPVRRRERRAHLRQEPRRRAQDERRRHHVELGDRQRGHGRSLGRVPRPGRGPERLQHAVELPPAGPGPAGLQRQRLRHQGRRAGHEHRPHALAVAEQGRQQGRHEPHQVGPAGPR